MYSIYKCKHEKDLGPESSCLYISVDMSYMVARWFKSISLAFQEF